MYRQVFTPTEMNNTLPFTIPREWYGQPIEFLVFPVQKQADGESRANELLHEQVTDKNFVSLSASALSKEWDSLEDAEWDDLLAQMPSIE